MSYVDLANSTQADLAVVNSNFLHIGQEDRYPMDGDTLGYTISALNIGDSAYKWAEVHIENVVNADIVQGSLNIISRVELSVTSSSISFTGLNGDTDKIYIINCNIKASLADGVYIGINNDSTLSYGYQNLYLDAALRDEERVQGDGSFTLDPALGETTTSDYYIINCVMYAKTGNERCFWMSASYGGGNIVEHLCKYGGSWDNTVSTVTSLEITANVANDWQPGSWFELWATR